MINNEMGEGIDTDLEEVIEYCIANNPPEFNYNKAIEECIEFQEVLVKLQTKEITNPKRPSREDAIKEFGDLSYRGIIALGTLFPEKDLEEISDKIDEHIMSKLMKLKEYRSLGIYKKGL